MPVSIHVRGDRAESDRTASEVARAFDHLQEADALFSTYRDGSAVSRINRGELTADDAGPLVREVLALCKQARCQTDGWFDVYRRVDDAVVLDPSGLVKSWAMERAAAPLRGLGGHDVCFNAGGDVLAWSVGEPWRVGVQDPVDPSRLLTVVEVTDGAVATSGTSARGQHVWDPFTGLAATAVAQVTVAGPSLISADVLATAAMACGPGAQRLLDDADGYRSLVVTAPAPGWKKPMTAEPHRLE